MTIREVAEELGVPERTLYRWVAALRCHLNGEIVRENGKVVISPSTMAKLQRIKELRQTGTPLREAIAAVAGGGQTSSAERQQSLLQVVNGVALGVIAAAVVAIAVALWVR